ncbi:hypothetical protein DER46DRAFT_525078, partial [Fusarium sp. MPI-SDFR-AT-0072]
MSPPSSKPHPEAFWPTIKKAIDNGTNANSDNEAITPQCPICMEPLPVRSFPTEVDRCEVNAIPLTIPKNGEGSSLPPGLPEGTQDLCPDCLAEVEFHRDVENGEWPHNLDDMEPGFVSLFYHVVDDIEKNGGVATEGRVQEAISDTIMQEFTNMMMSRRFVTLDRGNTLRQTNPWYAENNKYQENRRNGIIQQHFGPDSDDDDEPRINPSAGVPHPVPNPFDVQIGDRIEVWTDPSLPRTGYAHPDVAPGLIPAWANFPQPPRANEPSGVQDGVARPSAATPTTRSAQDYEMQAPDADADRLWYEFLEREGNSTPATAEAARPAAPRSLQEAFDYADANDILSLGDSIGGMPQQFRDYLARASATRPAT